MKSIKRKVKVKKIMEKAKEMLVNSLVLPIIYLAKVKPMKDNEGMVECVGNKKIDITDNAIKCVFEWFRMKLEDKNNPAENNYSITFPKSSKYTLWMLPTEKFEEIIEEHNGKKKGGKKNGKQSRNKKQ